MVMKSLVNIDYLRSLIRALTPYILPHRAQKWRPALKFTTSHDCFA
jgi:hypothetical protein